MANINTIKDEIAQDEVPTPVPVTQKNGQPYLAPNGEPCTVDLLGGDAKKVQAAKDKVQRRLLHQRRAKLEPADIRRNRIEIAAAAVAGWFGWTFGADDQPFPCTPDNVEAWLSAEHILEQVEAGVAGHSDFFSNASSS